MPYSVTTVGRGLKLELRLQYYSTLRSLLHSFFFEAFKQSTSGKHVAMQ